MNPVTENVQIAYRRRARKVIELSPFALDHCVSTENIQPCVSRVDQRNTLEVSHQEVTELEENAKVYEHLMSRRDVATGIESDKSLKESLGSEIDWEIENYYPSTERLEARSTKRNNELVTVDSEVLMALEEASAIRSALASEGRLSEKSENFSVTGNFESQSLDDQSALGAADTAANQNSSMTLEIGLQQKVSDARLSTDLGLNQADITQSNNHSRVYENTANVNMFRSSEQLHPGMQLPSATEAVTDSFVTCNKSLDDDAAADQTKTLISNDFERESLGVGRCMTASNAERLDLFAEEQKASEHSDIPNEGYVDTLHAFSMNHPRRPSEDAYLAVGDKRSVGHRYVADEAVSKESQDESSFAEELRTADSRMNSGMSVDRGAVVAPDMKTVEREDVEAKSGEGTLFTPESEDAIGHRTVSGKHKEGLSFRDDLEGESQKRDYMMTDIQSITRESSSGDDQRRPGWDESSFKAEGASVLQDQKAAELADFEMQSLRFDDRKSTEHEGEHSPADRGVISSTHGKQHKGTAVIHQDQSALERGEVPSKFMQGAFFGLNKQEEADTKSKKTAVAVSEDGGKQHQKKQEKKKKKKGRQHLEEEAEGDVLQFQVTVEETLIDKGCATDSATKSVVEPSHDLGDQGATEHKASAAETLPHYDQRASERGDKSTEPWKGRELLISDSQTSADWGDIPSKSIEKASTVFTKQNLADLKDASAEYLTEAESLGDHRPEEREDVPPKFIGEESLTLGDQTSSGRGIISGKFVEVDSLKKRTGKGEDVPSKFMESAYLSFDDQRKTDHTDVVDKSLTGRNIPTKPLEEAAETTLTQDANRTSERGDIPAKSFAEESLALDDSSLADRGVISSKSFQIASGIQKEKGTVETGDVPSKFMEGAHLNLGDQRKPGYMDVVGESLEGKRFTSSGEVAGEQAGVPTKPEISGSVKEAPIYHGTSERVDYPTRSVKDALLYLGEVASTEQGLVPGKDTGKVYVLHDRADDEVDRPEYMEQKPVLSLDHGDDQTKSIEGFDVEQEMPVDRGIISGRLVEGAFIPTDKITAESSSLPPKFMEKAYFGLDDQDKTKHGDVQAESVEEGMGEMDLEITDGGSQSHFVKKKEKKDRKKKKKGSQQLKEAEETNIPPIHPTEEKHLPVSEPLPNVDSCHLVSDSQKDDAIHDANQSQVSSVSFPAEELQEQKRQKEIEEQKRLLELEEQKRLLEIERQKYLQELEEQKRLEELEEQKRLHELEKKHLKELEEQKRLQELEDQKRLAELEEQKRLEELEEQKHLKELEEQKRLKELEEQKRLQELEEQKRLKEHEQKRVQKIKELQDERKACCLPFIERLDLLGQKLAHISKQPSQPDKLEERMQQLEECQKDLKELETNLLTSKNEWSDVSIGEDGDDPFSVALSNLNTLKNEVRKCSDSYQQLIDDRREKQDELSKIVKRFDIVELWFHSAKTAALGKPVHTTSSRFQQEQLSDITDIYEELDARLQQLHDITDQLHSLPECEDLKAESRLEEKLESLQSNISNLKDTLAEKLKNLKEDTEKSEKKQKEMQNLEASLVDIQKKVSQMLRSNELPSNDDLEIWKQMPKPNRELQQMLEAEIQEQMELVKTVADQHDSLKAAPPEMNISLPARSMWYTPLPLSVVTREPGSSRVLEAAIQMKVADLRKYWQNFKQNSDAGLEEYQCGQRKFGDLMSTAFQWLDCMEGQAARPTTAADLQDLQRQTKQFRLIYDELVEQQGVTGEIGQSLKDKLPASTAQQYMLSIRSLEDLDRRLALLEEEKRSKEHQAMERKEWQKNLENQVTDVEKEVHDYEQQYLSLSDGKMPCETRLTVAKQLDDDCKEGLHRLDALRTEVELRFIQDPAVAIPPELFSVRHHLINLHDKVAEKKVDLSRTTSSNVQYETLLEQYAEFLETAHEKVKAAAPSVSDLSQLKDQLFMHKEFFQDLVSHQTLLETIGRKVEPQEKERYHSSHARLNSLAHGVLDKANAHETRLKQAIDQWSEFEPQLNERVVWMGNIEKRLPRPTSKNDSIETLEQSLQDLQVIQRELEAEKGPISQAVDSGRQLLKLVACPALSRKLDDFVDRHKKLSDELVEELKSLEALVKLSKQFDSEADLVERWVKTAGGQKDSIKKLLAKDVKQAEDSLLELKRDCEDYQSHKTSAVSLGNKLLRSRPSDTRVHNRLKLISDNWLTLLNDVADVETKVQDAQRALLPSRQALVELLQWLDTVQQSITQDGSTRPRNREDVRQLLKKYKLLKGDLTHRLLNIDYVNKSAEQIQGSKQASHMDQALSAERLGEMNKQYQSLCSDVDNKVIKLEMACDTWKEYEAAVQNLRDWLESESVRISQEEKNLHGIAVEPILKNCKHVADALKGEKEKDLESVKCLGSALMKSSDWPANAESINSVLETLSHQCKLVEDKLNNLQRLAEDRKRLLDDYNLALNDVNDTVDHTQTSLNKLQQTSGCDSANLKEQVVKLQGLQKDFEGSKEALRKLSSVTSVLVSDLDPVSSKTVQDGQKKVLDRWQKLKELISERLSDLETLSSNWNSYNDEYNSAFSWLNKKGLEIERLLQNELPEDKDETLRDITAKQQELIAFRSKLSDLEAMSKELLPSLDSARVVYILSNQTSLNQQADSLQQLVERRLQNFGSIEDNREKFTELCQKVEALLKEAKDGLTKASLPYNSSDQEVVQERLKLVKNLSVEFTQMNPNFTELNHTGYRLPLSKADSDRLKKINDQWQELHSECCEQHKKLQQQLLLLQSFADKCEEWNSFLAEVENYLKGGICGNYNSVLEQQQKLEAFQHDVFPHQQILYSIINDGHEMMENSRGNSGAEDFGRKLQLLEEQWQTIVRQANRRKALVDNIVTLWQTYREMIDELSGTIGRVRKFVDSHPVIPDTFSSVRHHVDEYKDFHNQLNALQPLIDKLQSYSLLLSPNSDSTTVNQLEFEVKILEDEAKNLSGIVDSNMKQLEDTLALWEITQSNLESFVAWMKEIKSFLTPDVPNKYNTLVKELEKLQSLQSDRSDQCDELTKNLEQLTQFITPGDTLILCQRLRLLTKQQSEVSRQIADRCQVVRDRLNRWTEFDKNSDALLAACASFEKKIDNLDDLSIEDAISEIQNDLQLEMERLEGCKEELTGIGNELRRNSQDLRASDIEHKIANINDKCSRLQEILNERVNKLTVALGTLQQLEKKIKDLRWWLLSVEHLLTSPTVYETCSNAEIQHQLKEQLALQKDIDDHNLPVVSVLNLCETLSSDKIACPSALEGRSIRQARDLLESRWRKINTMSTERKKLIEETGQLWQKFNNAHQEFTVWLKVVERQVVNPKTHGATFKALKEERTAIQKLQVDVQKKLSDLDSLNRLYCRLAHEGRTDARKFLKKKIDDANVRWDNLLARAAAIVKRLSHIISIKADFDAHHLALVIWLSSFNDVLTELEQLAAGPPNAKILNFIKKELASNSVRLEYIDRASRYLMQRCEPSDAALIQQHVDEFHALHESILCQLKRLENRLHLAAGPDAVMDDEQSRGKIRQLETQLEGSRKNISSSQIHDAVGRLEVNFDDDWDSGQGQGMHPDWEEDVGSRITGGYSLLGDESVLVELANLEGWLYEANATLDSEKKSPQDMAQFDRCLKKHCALKEQIKTWKPRVFRIRSALSPIAHHTQFTEELCDRISTVIARWDRVCQRTSDWFIRLQLQLMQRDELHMSIEDLASWVEDVRVDLDSLDLEKPADYTTPTSVVEAKRKKLMMVERDLKDIRVNLDFIRDIAEYFLQDSTSDAAVEDRDELAKIADDLEALQDAYSNHQTVLEGVGGKSFEHSLMSGEDYFSQSSVFPLGSSGRRIPRYAHPSAGKQKRQEQPTKGAADLTTHDTASYLGLLKRACRTAIPIQLMMLLLIGVASLVPMCENECILNALDPLLKYADGSPPL